MKILFLTLTNIGDVILSLPVLDRLIEVFPDVRITVTCGRRAAGLFEGSSYVSRCIPYNKKINLFKKIKLITALNKGNFDLIVDLKNSVLPLFLKSKYKTYPWFNAPPSVFHMRERHLYKLRKFNFFKQDALNSKERYFLSSSESDRQGISKLFKDNGISASDKILLLGPGARSHIKRWPAEKFAALADKLIESLKTRVIIAGDKDDAQVCAEVAKNMQHSVLNLCGLTTLTSLAAFIDMAALVICCDSAIMHMASYLDKPVIAVFGPTNELKYGPWGSVSKIISSNIACRPCEVAQCKRGDIACMNDISLENVYSIAEKFTKG